MFNSGQDDALITLCGFDDTLFCLFEPSYWRLSPHSESVERMRILPNKDGQKEGAKRLFSAAHYLGLVLAWTQTQGSIDVLQLLFGGTSRQCL